MFFYAFPPFSVIMRTLQKIQQDQATGLLIVPLWPTQTWWPPLTRMLIQPPLVLPNRHNTLYLPQNPSAVHPLHSQMSLLLCHLSGNIYKVKAFHRQLQTSSCSLGVQAPGVQYSCYIKKWMEYCRKWETNPISPLIASGLNFLAELYHKGLS